MPLTLLLRDGRHVVIPAPGGIDIARFVDALNGMEQVDGGNWKPIELGDSRVAVRLCEVLAVINESEPGHIEIRTPAAPKTMRVTSRDAAGLLAEAEVSP